MQFSELDQIFSLVELTIILIAYIPMIIGFIMYIRAKTPEHKNMAKLFLFASSAFTTVLILIFAELIAGAIIVGILALGITTVVHKKTIQRKKDVIC